MCGSMVDIQSAATEIRRGIKKDRRKKPHGKNIMSASATQGGHNQLLQPNTTHRLARTFNKAELLHKH